MEFLSQALPILIYILISIFLIILIIFGIKGLQLLKKIDTLVNDVQTKVQSLSKLFDMVSVISNLSGKVADSVIDLLKNKLNGLLDRKNKKNKKKESELE